MKTEPCEAVIGQDMRGSNPVLLKCGKPGKLYQKFLLPFGVILCPDCYRAMEMKHSR